MREGSHYVHAASWCASLKEKQASNGSRNQAGSRRMGVSSSAPHPFFASDRKHVWAPHFCSNLLDLHSLKAHFFHQRTSKPWHRRGALHLSAVKSMTSIILVLTLGELIRAQRKVNLVPLQSTHNFVNVQRDPATNFARDPVEQLHTKLVF